MGSKTLIIYEYQTLYEILSESKKYSDRGFNGKITPYSLLIMTRMLFKYRNNNNEILVNLNYLWNFIDDIYLTF